MTLKHIFAKPEWIEGIGEVYPVKLKEYDEFVEYSTILYYKKDHFKVDEGHELSLLDLLCFGLQDENVPRILVKLFSLVLKKEVQFYTDETVYGFIVDENNRLGIHSGNFDRLREIIMKQNLMHEQKIWKDPLAAEWANKVIQARAKNSIKMELEDMVTTVATFSGKHYWDLSEYTYYQIKAEFDRINKFKGYDTGVAFKCAGADKVDLDHYAENIDMFKNPYDGLFKSKDSLGKLDSALGG